jgi:hypothetical protein
LDVGECQVQLRFGQLRGDPLVREKDLDIGATSRRDKITMKSSDVVSGDIETVTSRPSLRRESPRFLSLRSEKKDPIMTEMVRR